MKQKFLKKLIMAIIIIAAFTRFSFAQTCGNTGTIGGFRSSPPCAVESYINFNTSAMRDRVIRVTIHVFQKPNGAPENFDPFDNNGNPTAHRTALVNMVYNASEWMSHLLPLELNNGSPTITDTRIRYDCVQVLEWKNEDYWGRNDHNIAGLMDDVYTFVTTQPSVLYKFNSVHIFLPGKPYQLSGKSILDSQGGVASDFGDKKFTMMNNTFDWYNAVPSSSSTGLFMHELGHNIGLRHPCASDGCDDTPDNNGPFLSCSWCGVQAGCGNNVMDYNPIRTGLSRCQVLTAHAYLLGFYPGKNIKDCLRDPLIPTTPNIVGTSCISGTTSTTYTLSNYEFGTEVNWSVSPANLFVNSSGCGNNFTLTPVGSINSNATLTVTVNWGTFGITTNTKAITLGTATPINGTFTFPGTTQNIPLSSSQPNIVNGFAVYVTLNAPSNTTFTWTRTTGTGVMVSSNFGRNGSMNMSPGTSTNYYVSYINSCGTTVSRPFTFYRPSSSLFTVFPNPASNQINITANAAFTIDYLDDKQAKQKLIVDPGIDKIRIFDDKGLKVYEEKQKVKSKSIVINSPSFKIGVFTIEIQDGDKSYVEQVLIVR